MQGGESEIGRTEGGWIPELTERSEVSTGNFQPHEVRPIPDSPNLQLRGAHPHKICGGGGELDCGTDFPNSDIQI